jgi:hypothetical protein
MKAWKIAIAVALAAVLGLLVWLGASRLERYSDEEVTGFRGEARRNPLLALERLFERLGIPASSRADLGELPASDHAVVWLSPGDPLAPKRERELVDWIERGGHLVLLAPSAGAHGELFEQRARQARPDLPLQAAFGFAYRSAVEASEEPERVDEDDEGDVIALDLGHRRLEIAVHGRLRLDDPEPTGRAIAADGEGTRAITFQRGAGRATIVASHPWATNLHIGEHDHARAARELVLLAGPRAGVLLVHGESRGGLLARIARTGWMALASLAAWLALWLWHRGSRFGPLVADPPAHQRAFAEHVVSSGEFLWRHGASQALLEAPRRELRRRIQRRRPDLEGLDAQRLHAELARSAGIEPRRVAEALGAGPVTRPDELTRIARTLATMEEKL